MGTGKGSRKAEGRGALGRQGALTGRLRACPLRRRGTLVHGLGRRPLVNKAVYLVDGGHLETAAVGRLGQRAGAAELMVAS